MEDLVDLVDAVVAGNIAETKEAVRRAMDRGIAPLDIIEKGIVPGLDLIGKQFAAEEVFLPEILLSSIAAREGNAIAMEGMDEGQYTPKASMVLGTVKGDIHNIGKDILATILRSRGFAVVDLGVDVHEEEFVNAVREHRPDILGMSCLMTATMMNMKGVISALTEAGLRDSVKVIVGGCPVSQAFASEIGADYYSRNAGLAVDLLEEVVSEVRGKST